MKRTLNDNTETILWIHSGMLGSALTGIRMKIDTFIQNQ